MFTYFAISSTTDSIKRIVQNLLITYTVQHEDTNDFLIIYLSMRYRGKFLK
jgi:hypothetical protein